MNKIIILDDIMSVTKKDGKTLFYFIDDVISCLDYLTECGFIIHDENMEEINMKEEKFECVHENECYMRKQDPEKCGRCRFNSKRNFMKNYFMEADDDPIPDKHIPAKGYDGPAEQTKGYECPICHGYTNPYELTSNKTCRECGYPLFLK